MRCAAAIVNCPESLPTTLTSQHRVELIFHSGAWIVFIASMGVRPPTSVKSNLRQRLRYWIDMMKLSRLVCAVTISAFVALSAGCASTATQESTGQMVDSSLITTNVKAALAGDELGTLMSVEVETFRDIVQLSGFVDTEEEKAMAGEIAEGVDGVMRVENNLIVKPSAN